MSGLPILTYHSLDDSGSVISTSPSWFRATMKALCAEGFHCVDLRAWVRAGRPAIDRGFAITFDDGLESLRIAAKTLARFGLSATAFLVTGRMNGENDWDAGSRTIPRLRLIDWSDLDDLASAGFHFGAHTVTHPSLGSIGPRAVEREMVESRDAIAGRTGVPCDMFAYPYGEAPPIARAIVARHFAAGFGTRLATSTEEDDVTGLARIDAYYLQSPRNLKRLITGRLSSWLRVRRLARAARGAISVARNAANGYRLSPSQAGRLASPQEALDPARSPHEPSGVCDLARGADGRTTRH